jgi:gluconokinase
MEHPANENNQSRHMKPTVIILMGVSGCGKTTVGLLLAQKLDWGYYDADQFHPAENVQKMSQGIPLTDEDRQGWLLAMRTLIQVHITRERPMLLGCSALKQTYRDLMQVDKEKVQFVHLKGDFDLIWSRMLERQGHYMKAPMLVSQFNTLEEPAGVLTLDIHKSPDELAHEIIRFFSIDKFH